MKRRSWVWTISALMLAVVLMWFPTVLVHISEVDSPRDVLLGAPLPWRSPSITASLAWDIALVPVLLDALFWILIASALIHTLEGSLARAPRVVGVVVFVGLTLSFAWAVLWTFFVLIDPYFLLWYPENLSFEGLSLGRIP